MPSLTHTQEGYFIGLTLHELANVVGAAGAISPHTRSRFNRQNDTRYFTCSCFTYRALFFRTEQERRKLHILCGCLLVFRRCGIALFCSFACGVF
ncbi:YeiH family protein [Campylobacter upsaliensis]|uniref:YeiH family protein n=1 Tax=Campylobacter upsaliensis TaxID=28080 RepID=UPI002149F07E|nr:YeiH family protein [Campylobacter upsaliensis]MCR2101145.1 YeiH family protein [Campylobacter upsaliensis]